VSRHYDPAFQKSQLCIALLGFAMAVAGAFVEPNGWMLSLCALIPIGFVWWRME